MNIILSSKTKMPIYEQIKRQLINQILNGTFRQNEKLPSIRGLARDLGISVITVKRAYDDLESEGYIHTIGGKGSFVESKSIKMLKEKKMQIVEEKLHEILKEIRHLGTTRENLDEMISSLWEEDE